MREILRFEGQIPFSPRRLSTEQVRMGIYQLPELTALLLEKGDSQFYDTDIYKIYGRQPRIINEIRLRASKYGGLQRDGNKNAMSAQTFGLTLIDFSLAHPELPTVGARIRKIVEQFADTNLDLTTSEFRIIEYAIHGKTSARQARETNKANTTVSNQRKSIYDKTGDNDLQNGQKRSLLPAVIWAVAHGKVDVSHLPSLPIEALTPTEVGVLLFTLQGFRNKEIGDFLHATYSNAIEHRKNLYKKCGGIGSPEELVAVAVKSQLPYIRQREQSVFSQ